MDFEDITDGLINPISVKYPIESEMDGVGYARHPFQIPILIVNQFRKLIW